MTSTNPVTLVVQPATDVENVKLCSTAAAGHERCGMFCSLFRCCDTGLSAEKSPSAFSRHLQKMVKRDTTGLGL